MSLAIGMIGGFIIRLLVSFLGASRIESMVTALVVMNGINHPDMVLGFFSTWIGFKGLSIPMDVMQPVNVASNPFLQSYMTKYIGLGEAPRLIRGMYFLEIYMGWLIMIGGFFFLSAMWAPGMKGEFNSIVMTWSPWLISFIWLGNLMKSKRKPAYVVCMVMVGAFGLFITNSGVGQFGVLIVLSMMFLGLEGLSSKRLPEQNWNYGSETDMNSFDTSSIFYGIASAIFIGCPSSPLVYLREDEYDSEGDKFRNHLVASKVSEMVSLFLWFYFGASRGVESDVLDKTVGALIDNYHAVIGFIVIVLLCQFLTWHYLDLIGKLNWLWSKFICPIKLLNLAITLVTVLFYIPLGMPIILIPIALGIALCIRELISRMKVEPQVAISMVSIIPLFGIWI